MPWLRAPREALGIVGANPAVTRSLVAQLAVDVGRPMAMVALTVLVFEVGGASLLGIALTLQYGASALATPVLSATATRHAPLRLFRVGSATAVTGGVLAAAAALLVGGLAGALLVTLGCSVLRLGDMTGRVGRLALLPDLTDDPRVVAAANVLDGLSGGVGYFLGPAAAAALLLVGGVASPFVVAGLLTAVAVVSVRGIDDPGVWRRDDEPDGGLRRVALAQWHTLSAWSVRLVLGVLLVQTMVSGGLGVLYAPLAIERLGLGDAGIGLLRAAFGAGGIAGSIALFGFAATHRLGILCAVGLALWSLPLVGLGLTGAPLVGVVLLLVVGLANALFDLCHVTLLQRTVPETLRATVFGMLEGTVVVGAAAGAALAPLLLGWLGLTGAAVTFGVAGTVVAVAVFGALSALDHGMPVPSAHVALLRRTDVFGMLPARTLDLLALRMRRRTLQPDTLVVGEGEAGSTYYVIEDGEVAVTRGRVEVARLGAPDGFGEIALLRDVPRTASVSTVTAVVLHELDRGAFLAAVGAPDSTAQLVASARLPAGAGE